MNIQPRNLTLDKLLQDKLFRIPDYQRAYSWETKQRNELFGDIKKLAENPNKDRHHFMSTVVCLQTDEKEEVGADEFVLSYIVDGQQRITTLIILLKALAKVLAKGDATETRESSKINELLVKADGTNILLQTNHDNNLLLRNYLTAGKFPEQINLETLADKNMIKAFNECERFVDEWKQDNNDIIFLLKLVKNRLDFIFYVLDDEGAVHTIFEVVNSRGLEVDWLDKCKSILMGIACEKFKGLNQKDNINQIHQCWSKIYRKIGLKKIEGQEILRFAAALEGSNATSKISSAEKAIEFFRDKCQQDPGETVEVSENFLNIAEQLEKLITDKRLKAVTKILHARLLATAIMLNEVLEEKDKSKLLKEWEKVTFRIFGLSKKDARTKIGEYVNLAREIFQITIVEEKNFTEERVKFEGKEYTRDKILEEITQKMTDLGKEYPVKEVANNLREADCYNGWQDELVYFLYRYEEYLTKEDSGSISDKLWTQIWNSSPIKTIEHIYPQTANDPAWKGKLGANKADIEKHIHRLGNLIVLTPSTNSKATNKPFQEKKEIYKDDGGLKLLEKVIALNDWDIKTLEEREEKLIKFVEQEWG